MNDKWEMIREVVPVVLILGFVIGALVDARHRLRPVYLWVAGFGAIVSVPITVWFIAEARAGNLSGWGGLGALLIVLPAAFVAALSLTALLTLAVLIPRYGFNPPTKAERDAAWKQRWSPEGRRAAAIFRLKFSAVGLVIVLLVIWLRKYVR